MKPSSPEAPIRLFYAYSHTDERLRDKLEEHLSLLRRQGVVHEWHDRKIGPGTDWDASIHEHFEAAHIILLLISSAFLNSDYCYNVEMKRALEKHNAGEARVIPVILRPVDWHSSPFGKLQALPKDGKAVTTWRNRDEAWVNVAKGLREVVQEIANREPPGPRVFTAADVSHLGAIRPTEDAGGPIDIDRRIRAHVLYGQAQQAHEPKAAEELAKQALDLDPSLPGVHSFVGLRLSNAAAFVFREERVYRDILSRYPEARLGSGKYDSDTLALDAIQWLEGALHRGDDPGGQVSVALALMYGAVRRYGDMIVAIERALSVGERSVAILQASNHVIMLAHACADLEQLRHVGSLVSLQLPASDETVAMSVERADPSSPFHPFADWFALEREGTRLAQNRSKLPALVRLFRGAGEHETAISIARYFVDGMPVEDIPPEQGTWLTVDQLLARLHDRFFFICQTGDSDGAVELTEEG